MRTRELLSVAVFYIDNRLWRISTVMNIEERAVFIGLTDCGALLQTGRNKISYKVDAVEMLQDAIETASDMLANRTRSAKL